MLDREAMRLYKRGQRRQWREQGLCVICGAAVGRAGRKTGGDRLLFLAWALMISGWLAMLDRWGVLVR